MSEHMGIPSFIQNVNYLAQNTHLLQLSEGLLTPETVKALKVATGLPFSEIIKDISKGVTSEGRRKIDIGYAEVPDRGSDYAHYTAITITGSLDKFSYTHQVGSVGVHELYDVRGAIRDAIDAYNGAASAMGLSPIENCVVEVYYPENPCKRPGIRIRDDDPEAAHTFLSSITLHTESGIDFTTNWNDTTSALLSLGANQSQIYTVMATTEGFASDASISAAGAGASAAEAKASENLAGEYRDDTQNISDAVNAAMLGFLHSIEYNVAGKYAAGLVLTAPNDIVRMPDGTYWGIVSGTELPLTLTGNIAADGHYIREYPFASMKSLEIEVVARQAADVNLQAQLRGAVPLEASAFSPISWHDHSIENSVTIPSNKNAWSFGPTMTIAEGQAVTVSEGSFWTIANGEVQQ